MSNGVTNNFKLIWWTPFCAHNNYSNCSLIVSLMNAFDMIIKIAIKTLSKATFTWTWQPIFSLLSLTLTFQSMTIIFSCWNSWNSSIIFKLINIKTRWVELQNWLLCYPEITSENDDSTCSIWGLITLQTGFLITFPIPGWIVSLKWFQFHQPLLFKLIT